MNHTAAFIWISCQYFYMLHPELGNLLAVGCQAKVKNPDMHNTPLNHSKQKFLRDSSTSDMTLSACAT